jgi:hypothetical protein
MFRTALRHLAAFVLHQTAAAMLFLVEAHDSQNAGS